MLIKKLTDISFGCIMGTVFCTGALMGNNGNHDVEGMLTANNDGSLSNSLFFSNTPRLAN